MTAIDETTTAPYDLKLAGDVVEGLRALADLLEANPELTEHFRYANTLSRIHVPVSLDDDPRASMAAWARAGKSGGHPIVKDYNGEWGSVTVALSDAVKVYAYAKREQVCTRIVTGVETVVKTVPDPTVVVPMVEVETTREIVRWECLPLLAEQTGITAEEYDAEQQAALDAEGADTVMSASERYEHDRDDEFRLAAEADARWAEAAQDGAPF